MFGKCKDEFGIKIMHERDHLEKMNKLHCLQFPVCSAPLLQKEGHNSFPGWYCLTRRSGSELTLAKVFVGAVPKHTPF